MDNLRILFADDSKPDRLILQALLKKEGYTLYVAEDGHQAINLYSQHQPDIVLLDASMPIVNGYEAVKLIKKLAGDNFVPVIFLTALTDADALAKCLEAGGDDFLSKPYNPVILKAKIEAFARINDLHTTIREQRDEIEAFHDELISEQHLAHKIFDKIAHSGCLDSSNIAYNQTAMSIFNGDILFAAKKPSGNLQVFIGDFTGHSLPAAIGAMPVAEIFYEMTVNDSSMEEMLNKINQRLNNILPVEMFCCAICVEIDYDLKTGRIWNGGLPEAYLITQKGGIQSTFPSQHLALGIVNNERFSTATTAFNLNPDNSLFLATDGIIESEAIDGEMFGVEKLYKTLDAHCDESIFEKVLNEVSEFSQQQTDDITFLEIYGAQQ